MYRSPFGLGTVNPGHYGIWYERNPMGRLTYVHSGALAVYLTYMLDAGLLVIA